MEKIIKELEIEKALLDFKVERLHAFILTEKFNSLAEVQKNFLLDQHKAMKDYSSALLGRIEDLKATNILDENIKTKGEEIIGNFNPGFNDNVAELKLQATSLINFIEKEGKDPRRKAKSYTDIEQGLMFAVKSLFH